MKIPILQLEGTIDHREAEKAKVSRPPVSNSTNQPVVTDTISVPSRAVGRIIGIKGKNIRYICTASINSLTELNLDSESFHCQLALVISLLCREMRSTSGCVVDIEGGQESSSKKITLKGTNEEIKEMIEEKVRRSDQERPRDKKVSSGEQAMDTGAVDN